MLRRSADPGVERWWRRGVLVQLGLSALQLVVGAGVGLYGHVPSAHAGSHTGGGGYGRELVRSFGWSLTGAPSILRAHVALGLLMVLVSLALGRQAMRAGGRLRIATSVLAAAGTIGAFLAGTSALVAGTSTPLPDFLMTVAFAVAASAYVTALTAPRRPSRAWTSRYVRTPR